MSSGEINDTSSGNVKSLAIITSFNSKSDMSTKILSGTSVGKHSISIALLTWVTMPPSTDPTAVPSKTKGSENVIFSVLRTRIRSR